MFEIEEDNPYLKPKILQSVENEDEKRLLKDIITLKNINLDIKHGEFMCIIGDVGSGKSSLLSALIGDMLYLPSQYIQNNQNRLLTDHFIDELTIEA